MTTPPDPALAASQAHEARRRRPLPPLDDLLAEDDALPLDWAAAPIAGVRCAGVPAMAGSIAGTVIITIVAGWVGGYVIALVLLNEAVLSMLGIAP